MSTTQTKPRKQPHGQRWIIQSADGRYPDSCALLAQLTSDLEQTYVYDERDNREVKLRFYAAIFRQNVRAIDVE